MRNARQEEIPLLNIERSPLLLIVSVITCILIIYFSYSLFTDFNPWGFMVMIPAAVIFFQLLWLLVNPFALVFDDKIEIRQSMFHNKLRYYVDIKRVSESKNGRLYLTYNDDEMEALNLFGIRNSHVQLLKAEMEKFVAESLKTRL